MFLVYHFLTLNYPSISLCACVLWWSVWVCMLVHASLSFFTWNEYFYVSSPIGCVSLTSRFHKWNSGRQCSWHFSLKIVATDLQCMNWAFHHESHSRNVLELLERLKFEYNVCLIFSDIELLYCGFCLLSILVHVIWWSKFVFLLITGSRQISPAWRLCCLRFLGANGTGNSWYLICSQRGAEEVSCVLLVNKCLSSITCYCV